MPLFTIKDGSVKQQRKKSFKNEKELQIFIEKNLETLFGVRFLTSEYTTSQQHGGRIDSLGLDEDNSPVIVEYKWGEKDNIINQGLFYLDWLVDHTGDFQLLVHGKLGKDVKVDYGAPRLILVAQSFSKYDQYAINRMAENIELWSYSLYENNLLELNLVASSQAQKSTTKKRITKVNYEEYTVEEHLQDKPKEVVELFKELREKVLALGDEGKIEEQTRKHYISYKTNRAFLYVHVQAKAIKMHLIVDTNELDDPRSLGRDVSKIGHYGYGNTEVILKSFDDLDYVMKLIKQSHSQSS